MKVHILQHSDSTPPGSVLDWLKLKKYEPELVRLHKGDALPSVDSTDWVIILGGPMNVDQVDEHPWLKDEKEFLKKAVAEHKTCLGLCLGGQLLAQTLGAEVKPHEHWEVGWHPIHLGLHLDTDLRLMAFQWHQDTFSLPEGAVRVATNRITENQGFMFGNHVVGLQFHPEATEEWIKECLADKEYPTGAHVQPPEQIMEDMIFLHPMRKWFFDLLNRMESVTKSRLQQHSSRKA